MGYIRFLLWIFIRVKYGAGQVSLYEAGFGLGFWLSSPYLSVSSTVIWLDIV